MLRTTILIWVSLAAACAFGQATPPVLLNFVNVCAPRESEKAEIAAALARLPRRPVFSPDFEVARGRTTDQKGASDWVRLRHEFASETPFSNVQFLLSVAASTIEEKLVFHLKANKPGETLQVTLEQEVTAGTPAEVITADTPPSRIRVERFGMPSLILARCPNIDQHAYEPLFATATEDFARYRTALRIRAVVGAELARLGAANLSKERNKKRD